MKIRNVDSKKLKLALLNENVPKVSLPRPRKFLEWQARQTLLAAFGSRYDLTSSSRSG